MWSKIFKGGLVVIVASVLTTLTINAGDNFGNMSQSLLGSVLPMQSDRCPEGMVLVGSESGGFCIDMYEVSPSEECLYDSPQDQGETRRNLDQSECKPVSAPDAQPWRHIAQHQAVLACAKVGKRLPTADEWYRAALGTPDGPGGGCAIGTRSTGPRATGEGEACVSAAGAYDMIGNVWEWVDETIVDGEYRRQTLPDEGYVRAVRTDGVPSETGDEPDENFNNDYFWITKEGTRGMFRGGFWGLEERAGTYSVYSIMSPSFVGPGLGFRCVQ